MPASKYTYVGVKLHNGYNSYKFKTQIKKIISCIMELGIQWY